MSEIIAVIGLGYVGLPLAVALSKHFSVIGFDKSTERIDQLKDGIDTTKEVSSDYLKSSTISFSADEESLKTATAYIVAVPTPIDNKKKPDLSILAAASETVARSINAGDLVVFESTVYPGVTEEFCGPILEKTSGLNLFSEIKLGYSPERINPGDKERTIDKIVKVVSGQDEETLERVDSIYRKIITAGTHRAPTIKVAEAAKVIENTQRDLNIALMNELAIIFDKLAIRTSDVLKAASTKWNFLPFKPGLVGGHCIGVDPYYLTSKAEEIGYNPHVILAGRRINDSMGEFVANKVIKLMLKNGMDIKGDSVGVYGITFKENVPDIRNSKIPSILSELREFGVTPLVFDPLADPQEVKDEYGVSLVSKDVISNCKIILLAVPHGNIYSQDKDLFIQSEDKLFIDIKGALPSSLWSL
ncbi:MAG: nucleotide sugar dehydrogenase [Pseudobacteriovorax sp.]|nr:nucleotide sugar dehydrogenase [Pseudobacteriovorax sp.]